MHFNKMRISARGGKSKKNRVSKEDIAPVVKTRTKNNKLKIMKTPLKSSGSNNYKTLSTWKNSLDGHPAFILGNAPGIEQNDLHLLDNYFTIGINRIFYIYDPTVLMWQDKQVWNSDKKTIMRQKSIKICSSKADPRKSFLNFSVKMGGFRFGSDPSVLYGCGNTTALAVQLAVLMGCSNIVLLGNDCKYGINGKTDFYGKNKDHKPYTLKMCQGAMQWLKDNCPVPIYNCSGNKLWESQKLSAVIKKLNPPKLNREAYRKVFLK